MVLLGYIIKADESEVHTITDKGIPIGVEAKKNRYGEYFISVSYRD